MKTVNNTLIAIAVTMALSATMMTSPFANAKDQPFEGVVIEQTIVITEFPDEVEVGSIAVNHDNDKAIAKQAIIGIGEVAAIAQKALPGKVIKAKLDEENDYLVWAVKVISPEGREAKLMIDAGNGRLLAAEVDEDDEDGQQEKHSKWKFWEHDDHDEQHEEGE